MGWDAVAVGTGEVGGLLICGTQEVGAGGVYFCFSASLWVRIWRAAARLIEIPSRCSGVRGSVEDDLEGGGVFVRLGGGVI